MNPVPDREARAQAEMAATSIGRATSRLLILAFLALIAAGAALQRLAPLPVEPGFKPTRVRAGGWREWQATWSERGPLAVLSEGRSLLRRLDTWSENDLVVVRRLRRPTQLLMLERLGYGNSQVRVGRDGWLFYEREIDALTGPPFLGRRSPAGRRLGDPATAILALGSDLRARGIALAVLPAPAKSAIEVDRLLGGRAPERLLRNPAFGELARRLADAGIALFDPAPALLAAARRGEPQFLRTDSHWRPETVDRVAAALAEEIFRRGVLPRPRQPRFRRAPEAVVGHPDLVRLLALPTEGVGPLFEPVTIQTVREADGALFVPRDAYDAAILLLGDSLAGNYGWGTQGYGSGAGLAEQLAFHLQAPVQAILEPAGGNSDSRRKLVALLRQGDDLLTGKRLVILEFAERELAIGRWRRTRFESRRPASAAAGPERGSAPDS